MAFTESYDWFVLTIDIEAHPNSDSFGQIIAGRTRKHTIEHTSGQFINEQIVVHCIIGCAKAVGVINQLIISIPVHIRSRLSFWIKDNRIFLQVIH